MAFGLHWEWRGFGAVSADFVNKYSKLDLQFDIQNVDDLYLWVPNLAVNAKFREGAEGGLKFKRIKNSDDKLEQWHENEEEIFDFPLKEKAWTTLNKVMTTVGLALPAYPPIAPNREESTHILESIDCKTIMVKKRREARLWRGPNGLVKVEWACISEPQSLISIGLETWDNDADEDVLTDEEAKEDIRAAILELGLNKEPIHVMNYLVVTGIWALGKKI